MKIGIITHYYQSKNYGGNLQAYALQRYLSKEYTVEQVCYQNSNTTHRSKKTLLKELGFWFFLKKCIKYIFIKLKTLFNIKNKKADTLLEQRKEVILSFNKKIPHSNICYNEKTIWEAEEQYDCFITGSDQVWHPLATNEAYLLSFVKQKPKISYAASLAVSQMPPAHQERMKSALRDYRAISVREENAVSLLQNLVEQPIEWVLDPVFLLDKEEWTELASETLIKEKYLFCYFLGADKKIRRLAKTYAQKKNLKIVTLPYLSGAYQACDKDFGDIPLFKIDPADFVSLIKNAECIFTDSFHALAFSRIFEKEYFVFNRKGHLSMNGRVYSICQLFDEWSHFCDTKEKSKLSHIETVENIDYTGTFDFFEEKKRISIDYLRNNLQKVRENIVRERKE